jgi:hypothetical protein
MMSYDDSNGPTDVQPDPDAELRARLESIKAERARLAEERELRGQSLPDRIEAEERALRDEIAIADAETAHGPVDKRIAIVNTSNGVVIVKRANHVLFRRFQDSKLNVDECEKLVRPCLVHPDKATFDRWAEEEPAIIVRAANALGTLAGIRGEEASGKY